VFSYSQRPRWIGLALSQSGKRIHVDPWTRLVGVTAQSWDFAKDLCGCEEGKVVDDVCPVFSNCVAWEPGKDRWLDSNSSIECEGRASIRSSNVIRSEVLSSVAECLPCWLTHPDEGSHPVHFDCSRLPTSLPSGCRAPRAREIQGRKLESGAKFLNFDLAGASLARQS
jgi:hypothetical protein